MQISIKADVKAMTKDLNRVQKSIVPQSVARALNKAGGKAQKRTLQTVGKNLSMTQKVIRKFIPLKKATWRALSAYIYTNEDKRVSVSALKARQTRKGVTYKGKGGKRTLIPSAFIVPSLNNQVFKRLGKTNKPIAKLKTVSIFHLFRGEDITALMDSISKAEFLAEFTRDLKYRLEKKGLI